MKVGTRIHLLLGLAGLLAGGPVSAGLSQTIEPVNIGVKTPTDPAFSLPATTSAGLPITWQALAGPASVSGTTVTLTGGTGAVTLRGYQPGDATHDAAPDRYATFAVSVGGGFVLIAAGDAHVAGIKTDGSLWTWGKNDSGQLGDGTTTDRAIPAPITNGNSGTSPWTKVSCGGGHTLALRGDGTLWAWGKNADGQLGTGSTTDSYFPTQIGSVSTWTGLACGGNHSAAFRADGSLWTWGDNSQGQLGDGTIGDRLSPVRIGVAQDWVQVSCGAVHTLGRRAGGSLWAWGGNVYGQLGDGTTTRRTAPVRIGSDSNWTDVGTGFFFSAGRRSDGTLWTWGNNDSGQLGDGTRARQTAPKKVGTDSNWTALNCGAAFVIGRKTDGDMWAWGDNSAGQLGDLTTLDSLIPTHTLAGPWTSVAAGAACVLAVKNGSLWTWGTNDNQQLALPPSLIGATDVPPAVRLPYPTPQSAQALPAMAGVLQTLTGTVGSKLPATLRVISGPAVISNDGISISFTSGGTAEIEISQPGDLAWEPAPPVVFSVQIDAIGPVFVPAPSNLTVQIESPAGTIVSYGVNAVDAVTGAATVTCVPPSGALFPGGKTTVTCTATDAFGNTRTSQFEVLVNHPPSFSLPPPHTAARVPVTISRQTLLASITDPDVDATLPLRLRGFSIPASTAFTVGSGATLWDGDTFTYTAAPGFEGTATITFPLSDGQGATILAGFEIIVAPVSSLPIGSSSLALITGGTASLSFRALPGMTMEIQRSTNLIDWTNLPTQIVPEDGMIYYQDAGNSIRAFYRIKPTASP